MALRDTPTIDFATFPTSDGEPMAETYANMLQMLDLFFTLRHLLQRRGLTRWAVGANQFLYFDRHNGHLHLAPDVYVALDVEPGERPKWETWIEEKAPEVVFEITSPSTQTEDLNRRPGGKFWRYEQLGVQEYYIYDPQDVLRPRFQGYARQGDRLEPLPLLASGGIVSVLLETELRPMATLRVLDRVGGVPLLVPEELQGALAHEAAARMAAEERAAQQEQARRDEAAARAAAEARAVKAEARAAVEAQEIAALRAALAALTERRDPPETPIA